MDCIIQEISRVILVGKEEYPEQMTSFSPSLNYHELIFHFSGQTTHYFNDKKFEIKPNMVRFLPKGENKKYDVIRKERGECIDIYFLSDKPLSEEAFILDVGRNERIARLFRRIFATWMAREEGYYPDCIAILYQIIAEMMRLQKTPTSHLKKIQPSINKIHQSFLDENLSIDELASLSGMKSSYFNRLFVEHYGISPKKYIITLKINYACELLRLGQYSITQVADLCGFANIYFFSRQFKEYMGITPTRFAKDCKSSK
ncbi:MAG: helix-turn-helix transcriptional regulator [Clostridia bacterium]|nr:helix-turn-helix transcriptional regulator [Clostridia bacterium]